ncbi:hypothetical protein GCM10012289_55350 [Nonomuraea cavernae]|uniref:Uncharacterized protein n=1 Tax=Nonomuraea cavernae TaxID=2045107 RepID=A0A918DNM1_9ACTN|nr:hypothetical protein GCM10012289_55350 [Nonomuraea cavernae]
MYVVSADALTVAEAAAEAVAEVTPVMLTSKALAAVATTVARPTEPKALFIISSPDKPARIRPACGLITQGEPARAAIRTRIADERIPMGIGIEWR